MRVIGWFVVTTGIITVLPLIFEVTYDILMYVLI